jgi:hypothetical protein
MQHITVGREEHSRELQAGAVIRGHYCVTGLGGSFCTRCQVTHQPTRLTKEKKNARKIGEPKRVLRVQY